MWLERPGTIPALRTVWCAQVETADDYLIAGSEYWGISFNRRVDGDLAAELDGPRLGAHRVRSVLGERYWGIELAPFVVLSGIDKRPMLGETMALPVRDERVLLGAQWTAIPRFDDLEVWVTDLIGVGVLTVDDDIRAAIDGDRSGASTRTWQRRFRRLVGLTAGQVGQVRRAGHAYELLQSGVPPVEAATLAGFADQAHLTRSLRLIRGRTPASILAEAQGRTADV